MPIYKYQPFYEYKITREQPLMKELTKEEIEHNIESFFSDISRYFKDDTATFKKLSKKCLEINTNISETECDERVKKCLNNLDLFSNKTCKH